MNNRGFTVIELVVVTAFVLFAGGLFFIQKHNLEVAMRDKERKIAINAMYYGLEEAFYKQHAYYPEEINEKNLTTVDEDLFTDPSGIKLGQASAIINSEEIPVQSEYRYEALDCTDGRCKGYVLRADLEGEDDYVKKSRN